MSTGTQSTKSMTLDAHHPDGGRLSYELLGDAASNEGEPGIVY